jgi:MoaA/NifB/PqqE/SkfB family radical SAM enzyme
MGFDRWFQDQNAPLKTWTVLGREISGVVSWNVNDTCNYRCSYCTQRPLADRSHHLEDMETPLAVFAQLPGHWEIKLSGGEPFQQPRLVEMVEALVAQGHVISIQTNFSAPDGELRDFLRATRGALHVFSASLHLQYATPEEFLERFEIIRPYQELGVKFHVTTVGTPGRLVELRDRVAVVFRERKIAFKVQPEKVGGYVRQYAEEEKRILTDLGGHNLTGEIAHNFQGRLCHAGANYFVIKSTGEAFRCYPASRVGGRFARLGSLADGIKLLDGPRICPYVYCNCTVPIHRGMIADRQPAATQTGG